MTSSDYFHPKSNVHGVSTCNLRNNCDARRGALLRTRTKHAAPCALFAQQQHQQHKWRSTKEVAIAEKVCKEEEEEEEGGENVRCKRYEGGGGDTELNTILLK